MRTRILYTITSILLLVTLIASVSAQQLSARPERGDFGRGAKQVSEIDSVNLSSGTVSIDVPLASIPPTAGGKLGYTLSAHYDSKLWDVHRSEVFGDNGNIGCQPTYTKEEVITADNGGWRIGNKYEIVFRDAKDEYEYISPTSEACWGYEFYSMMGHFFKPFVRTPDGAEHEMRIDGSFPTYGGSRTHLTGFYQQSLGSQGAPDFTSPIRMYTLDGTYLTVVYNPSSYSVKWTIYTKDGTQVEQKSDGQRIKDTNGNSVLFGSNSTDGDFVQDEYTGRKIKWKAVTYNGDPATQVQYQSVGGDWQSVYVIWGQTNVTGKIYSQTGWNNTGGGEARGECHQHAELGYNLPVVRKIIFPATEQNVAAPQYLFGYNSDTTESTTLSEPIWLCGVDNNPSSYTRNASVGWGELNYVETPTGAKLRYSYTRDHVHDPGTMLEDANEIAKDLITSKAVEHDGTSDTWSYSVASTGTGGSVTNPDGSTSSQTSYPSNLTMSGYSGPATGLVGYVYRSTDGQIMTERNWVTLGGAVNAFGSTGTYIGVNGAVDTEYTTLLASDGTTREKMSAKKFQYDYNGELLQTIEYDWFDPSTVTFSASPLSMPTGVPSGATVLRVTKNNYYNSAADGSAATAYHKRTVGGSIVILGKPKEITVGLASGLPKSTTRFSYDGQSYDTAPTLGNLTTASAWNDVTSSWINTATAYSSRGNVTSTTDPKGNVTQITYGSINGYSDLYPTQTVAAYGTSIARISSATYDFYTGLSLTSTDNDNNLTNAIEYDILGRPVKSISAQGTALESWAITEYHDHDRFVVAKADLETKSDGKKVATQFYDQLGRVRLSKTLEDAATQSATNETDGIKVETRYKTVSGYTYQLTSNPFRASTSSAETDSTMGWTRSKSVNTGRHSEVETFSGAAPPAPWGSNSASTGKVQTDIDANTTTVTDQAGKLRRSITNSLGQLVRVDEPNSSNLLGSVSSPNQATYYTYNTLGKMVRVQQGSQNRYFMYDSLGRTLRVSQPEQETNTGLNTSGNPDNNSWTAGFAYDNNGNVLTTTDAKGTTITSTYDYLNRPLTRTYSDGTPTVTNYYDGTGLPSVPNYSRGKLTKVASSVSESKYTSFDLTGRLLESQQITDGNTYTSNYQYNLSGALAQETYPSGRVVKSDLDASGDLARIFGKATSTAAERTYATNFSYTPDGKIEKLRLGNGLYEAAKLNSRSQVTELALGHSVGDGSLMKLNYEYGELQTNGTVDGAQNSGNIAKQTVNFSGITNPFVQTYKYDSLDRITEAIEKVNGTQTWKQTFGYDVYGNRNALSQIVGSTELTINSSTLPTVVATTNRFAGSQGFAYDKNGNITTDPANSGRTFVFNGDNKQTEVKNSSNVTIGTYSYDGNGKRVKKVTDTETTIFVYDGMGKSIAEYSTATPPSNPTTNYTATDTLGSPRVLTNSSGEVGSRRDFMPFGEELYAELTNRTTARKYSTSDQDAVRQRFTGYQKDNESSLDFAEARMYDNRYGRFTAVDPLLASGKSADPQTFNRYAYALNRPLVLTDSTGLQAGEPAKPAQAVPTQVPKQDPSRDPSYNCMAWALGITDQWIQPNYSPTTGAQQPGFIVKENRTGPGTGDPKLMPPSVSPGDRPSTMTDIAKYYGADKSVKVKGVGTEKDRKVIASATSEAVAGQYKIVVFESNDIKKIHVMKQESDGTWSSKNGEGKLEKGIKDPEAYYQKEFNDPKAKANYLYREAAELGKKK